MTWCQNALGAKRSISYIIDKIVDAIHGIYNPHYAQNGKDLAFLILQFGGPPCYKVALCFHCLWNDERSKDHQFLCACNRFLR